MTAWRLLAAELVLGVALAVVAVFVAGAEARPSARLAVGPIQVTATLQSSSRRSVGRPGIRSDLVDQTWRLTDRHGTSIGRMLFGCRWVVSRSRLCVVEVTMPLGRIATQGSSLTPEFGEYAVVGGTGVYTGGGGTMMFTAIGARKLVVVITITR